MGVKPPQARWQIEHCIYSTLHQTTLKTVTKVGVAHALAIQCAKSEVLETPAKKLVIGLFANPGRVRLTIWYYINISLTCWKLPYTSGSFVILSLIIYSINSVWRVGDSVTRLISSYFARCVHSAILERAIAKGHYVRPSSVCPSVCHSVTLVIHA